MAPATTPEALEATRSRHSCRAVHRARQPAGPPGQGHLCSRVTARLPSSMSLLCAMPGNGQEGTGPDLADNRARRSTDWMAAVCQALGCIARREVAVVGEDVDIRNFTRQDRQRYRGKVRRCLDVFAEMLAEARFDFERPLTGLEIEFNLIDADQDPAMRNADVLAAIANEDFQTELGQFNIEINVRPRGLAGTAVAE